MKRNMLVEIISILFIFLFVYAAASKLIGFQKFEIQLRKSPLLTSFAAWVAWVIPAVEIGISVLLATARWRLAGLYSAFSLMVMFTMYIAVITRFSDYVPCSCGGVLQNMTWNQHLVFNAGFVMLGIAGILFWRPRSHKSSRPELVPG